MPAKVAKFKWSSVKTIEVRNGKQSEMFENVGTWSDVVHFKSPKNQSTISEILRMKADTLIIRK